MQYTTTAVRRPARTLDLAAIVSLAFAAWFLALLSDGFFADAYFVVSLALVLAVGSYAFRLWQALEQERALRRQAEELLRAAERTPATGAATSSPSGAPDPAPAPKSGAGPVPQSASQARERGLHAQPLSQACEQGEKGRGSSDGAGRCALSKREAEVLSLIANGATNRQIAGELHISLNTVERHVANIYRKLNVRGRVEAAACAVREGLVGARS